MIMKLYGSLGMLFVHAAAGAYNYSNDWYQYRGQEYLHKLTGDELGSFISRQKACLIFFYSTNCGNCTARKPVIAQAAAELYSEGSALKIGVLQAAVYYDTARSLGVSAVPTLNFYKNGRFVRELNSDLRDILIIGRSEK